MAKKYSVKFKNNHADLGSKKLKDLVPTADSFWFSPYIVLVQRELKRRNLKLPIKTYFSNEWFCPEGSTNIAIPFYLTSKTLTRLERQHVGFADGATPRTFIKTLRHELGHVVEHAFGLQNHPLRIKYFGRSSRYPTSYERKKYSKQYVVNLPDNYAQAHPDEDFAETFAVWLTSKTVWMNKYKNWPALKKLLAMDMMMKEIAGKSVLFDTQGILEPLESDHRTLNEYLYDKKRSLKVERRKTVDIEFKSFFGHTTGLHVSNYLSEHKDEISKQISKTLKQPKYFVEPVLKEAINRSKKLDLRIGSALNKSTFHEILDFMTEQTINFIYENRHRINM